MLVKQTGLKLPDNLKWKLEFKHNTDLRKVANYLNVIDICQKEINKIQAECNHEWVESSIYNQGKLVLTGGIARCPKCNARRDGWYCPMNISSYKCVYSKNEDQCDYCGEPSERN